MYGPVWVKILHTVENGKMYVHFRDEKKKAKVHGLCFSIIAVRLGFIYSELGMRERGAGMPNLHILD